MLELSSSLNTYFLYLLGRYRKRRIGIGMEGHGRVKERKRNPYFLFIVELLNL